MAQTRKKGATSDRLWVQPYLQTPGPNEITIVWWTRDSQPQSSVAYGLEELDHEVSAIDEYEESMDAWRHEVTLVGLSEQTHYRYRVSSGSVSSPVHTFSTAKARSSDLHIRVLGDGRTDDDAVIARHRETLEMAATDADLIFELGDAVSFGDLDNYDRLLRRILTHSDPTDPGSIVGSRIPYQLVIGNHELGLPIQRGSDSPADWEYFVGQNPLVAIARYQSVVALPDDAPGAWRERYYSLTYGAATFIILDANNTGPQEYDNHDPLLTGITPNWAPGSEQHEWMLRELARAQERSAFTFVLAHPSPFSRGTHGTPCPSRVADDPRVANKPVDAAYCYLTPADGDVCIPQGSSQRGYELRSLHPEFVKYGVDAVITSHDHIVERSLVGPTERDVPTEVGDPRNINYLVMGNSGYNTRYASPCWKSWMSIRGDGQAPYYSQWFYSWAGQDELTSFVRLDITNNRDGTWDATFAIRRSDGRDFDEFTITRDDPLGATIDQSPDGSN